VGDLTSNADGMRIELKRGDQILHYNLDQLRAKGAAQVFLQEGDRVVVPLNPFADKSVTVVGEIVKAGAVSFPANGKLDLVTVVGIAGGLTAAADPARISVKRDGKIWGLQMDARNQLLKPGDVITIPKSRFVGKVVILMGQVKNVGAVPFTLNGKLDILTAIANAGGYAPLANKKKVTVTRREGGRARTWKLNLTDMANGEEPLFQLLPGDTIMVPERKF
jgi:polysaccharide export outer membrane protein